MAKNVIAVSHSEVVVPHQHLEIAIWHVQVTVQSFVGQVMYVLIVLALWTA